jgi:hypothetical protein
LIALIFVVLGGLAALIANDVRDEPTDPTIPSLVVPLQGTESSTSTTG